MAKPGSFTRNAMAESKIQEGLVPEFVLGKPAADTLENAAVQLKAAQDAVADAHAKFEDVKRQRYKKGNLKYDVALSEIEIAESHLEQTQRHYDRVKVWREKRPVLDLKAPVGEKSAVLGKGRLKTRRRKSRKTRRRT